jgi:hypothetical protein
MESLKKMKMKSIERFKDKNLDLSSIEGGKIRTNIGDSVKDYQFTLFGKFYMGVNDGDGWVHTNCP